MRLMQELEQKNAGGGEAVCEGLYLSARPVLADARERGKGTYNPRVVSVEVDHRVSNRGDADHDGQYSAGDIAESILLGTGMLDQGSLQ